MARNRYEGAALCYAEAVGRCWTAHCLTFDLVVEGDSLSEVRAKLSDQIDLFLEGIADLPDIDQARLIRRRAPLLAFLQFFYHVLLAAMSSGARLRSDYTEPFSLGSASHAAPA